MSSIVLRVDSRLVVIASAFGTARPFKCIRSTRGNHMNPVVHFEMPAEDRNRMSNFYMKVFGWRTQMMGEDMGNYVMATTTEVDQNGHPKSPGAINGGF